jgi:hypothetical protein
MPEKPGAPAALKEFIRQERANDALKERLLEAVTLGARMKFDFALDIKAAPATPESASLLFARYQSLYRAPEIAKAIHDACTGNPQTLHKLRQDIWENGALIEPRSLEDFEKRLANPVLNPISVSSGRHPDAQSSHHHQPVIAADCQSFLPEDSPQAQRVVPLLNPANGDLIYDPSLYERIVKALPESVGLIDQMAVDREFAHLRLAAAARHHNLSHIKQMEREHPIEHMVGLAFCIQGLEVGEQVWDLERFKERSLVNMVSLLINEHSKKCPAVVVGRLNGQKVPVAFELDGKMVQGNLLVDWYYLDHQMNMVTSAS